ncbi:unnamed protein product, partial [Mesorhabditis belari]|uniref:Uncharacterized protein n=1 Tax=Mesorhabditis belari TaxID=2138241 RepID=A0AAF3FBI1_9BILA
MKVALVTGASSGIGASAAEFLAKDGFFLSLSGRVEEALIKTRDACIVQGCPSDKIIYTVGDINEDSVQKDFVQRTIEKFGQIDTLINAAGILVNGTVLDCPMEEYDRQMLVNVRSLISVTRVALPEIIKTKGTIVNVSSVAGTNAFPGVTYYCISKAAVDQFTKCLALEMASNGVRVNAVNPGVIVTDIHRRAGQDEETYRKFLEHSAETHALGRPGTVDEVSRAIVFLAGPASSFTTGHLLAIDGGRGIMTPR